MLDVRLAGHNIDSDVLEKLKKQGWDGKENLTPETISAAYARISRDPRPIYDLRKDSREEVDRARKSNESIVFKMGHHSVAEHAYLNFDILGISRLAVEFLEEARLCSYTEKSQRYITLDGDYVMPAEFNAQEKALFKETVEFQVDAYNKAFPVLHEYQKEIHKEKLAAKTGQNMVEGWAKEDARYMVSLATECQLGFSTNARNLEYIIRKLKYSGLDEVRQLSKMLYERAKAVVPSLIILSDPEDFKKQFGWDVSDGFLKNGADKSAVLARKALKAAACPKKERRAGVRLVSHTHSPDTSVLAAVIHSNSTRPYDECYAAAKKAKTNPGFWREFFSGLNAYDSLPRAFEAANFVFEAVVSAGAFGQLKRHRMLTLLKQPYDTSLGVTVPPSVDAAGQRKLFDGVMQHSESAYKKLAHNHGPRAEYALTNAHRRRIYINTNLREIYHIARLRMDSHAQWDIQNVSADMVKEAQKAAPISAALVCGKDGFEAAYKSFMKVQNKADKGPVKRGKIKRRAGRR
ncbi:MAG TPA: FAD-dependent thymidylate synthase [bacterium]|nr:FAD-dependent thymidylate synthase [bacterium]